MRTRLLRITLLTSILLAVTFAAAGQAFGQIDPAALYHITAKHSGKCLEVAGGPGATRDGVQVIQSECNAGDNQKWKFTPVGNDYYKIVARHSEKALDVYGGILMLFNGAAVNQWEYHGGANQMWKLIPVPSEVGYYRIVAKHSGLSLDIAGGPAATASARAQQWEYWGGNNQKWKLTDLTPRRVCATDQIGSTLVGGTSELTVDRVSSNPFRQPINLRIDFNECRAHVRVNFSPITTGESPTPIGPNATTVSLIAGGSGFVSPTRSMNILLTLHFQHSLEMSPDPTIAALGRPSDLTLTLSGQVASGGDVTLAGAGTFVGGYLNGSTGRLRVTGRLSPSP